jgi:hypothetical protein
LTCQIKRFQNMKKYPSAFRMAFAAITAAAIYLGVSCSIAQAQNTSTTNATSTPPPAPGVAQANPANPSGVFPGGPGTSTFTPGPGGGQPPAMNYGVGEVLKMYQGGINKEIIINYINSTALPYRLSADGIIYLQSLGLPQEITKAMLQRDSQLQQQQPNQQFYQPQPMPGAMPPPPNGATMVPPPADVATPSTPPPTVTVVGSDYPVYDYGYPYYYAGWPYYYGPGIVGGWGWGWGRGYGGFRGGWGGGFHGGFGGHAAFGGHGGGGGHR